MRRAQKLFFSGATFAVVAAGGVFAAITVSGGSASASTVHPLAGAWQGVDQRSGEQYTLTLKWDNLTKTYEGTERDVYYQSNGLLGGDTTSPVAFSLSPTGQVTSIDNPALGMYGGGPGTLAGDSQAAGYADGAQPPATLTDNHVEFLSQDCQDGPACWDPIVMSRT